jgi:protein-arginine kinase activator protein McsA
MKCDNCNKTATVHLTAVHMGKQTQSHLCIRCAERSAGVAAEDSVPMNELLTKFVLAHSGLQKNAGPGSDESGSAPSKVDPK